MAWIYKQKGKSENWFIGYRHNGKLVSRTTKTSDRKAAEKELAKVELIFGAHRAGSLTEELYNNLTGTNQPKITLWLEIEDWLAECRTSASEKTVASYESFAGGFKSFMGATEAGPLLSAVTTDEVRRFLNDKRTRTSAGTSNLGRKILSALFIRAVKNHHLRENPVSPIKPFKAIKGETRTTRRGFTLEELAKVYAQAPDDFWRTLILGGFYTGLRMGDLICLRWGAVDLANGRLVLQDDKTEKSLQIPIAKPLRGLLASVRARAGAVKPASQIWPEQAARYQESGSAVFSSEFSHVILMPCGLVLARGSRPKAKPGAGHSQKRQMNELSFHSLRHSFVSFLRSTGSNQAVAMELAGHASDHVNSLYTHVPEEALVSAINLLPEFVK